MRNRRMIGDWRALDNKECGNRRSLVQKRTNDFVLSKIREVVSNLNILKEKFKSKVLDKKNQKSDQIRYQSL
jgi:hypothetical protein